MEARTSEQEASHVSRRKALPVQWEHSIFTRSLYKTASRIWKKPTENFGNNLIFGGIHLEEQHYVRTQTDTLRREAPVVSHTFMHSSTVLGETTDLF